MKVIDINNKEQMNTMWHDSQKNGERMEYHFSKKNYRVPAEVRQDICDMTQLEGISRIEIRPKEDNCFVSFEVAHDKTKARELVGRLCSMIEVWRCHHDIVIAAVPQRLYYKETKRER